MTSTTLKKRIVLDTGRCAYFCSDFHLGVPSVAESQERERKIVSWLESIEHNAQVIFLVGDIFDFWFEYKKVVPKGFVRVLGKLAELSDKGVELIIFTGNHDMWMSGYLTEELGATIYRDPVSFEFASVSGIRKIYIGHGDGLGPGDHTYKFLKKIFENSFFKLLFCLFHPDLGLWIAHAWSRRSRLSHVNKGEERFLGEDHEWLFQYCREVEQHSHHDFYVFGHRHLVLDMKVNAGSRYINLGEWVKQQHYAVFDGDDVALVKYAPAVSREKPSFPKSF
ncbi:UDP-2,3-diacylglucosamine diphosphatase [Dyadobacter sandarakinus]|uniref:UDP-2,3-diacylglucosamine diphosphatase n=1 Tax=Dyadobacter sandarakinus TaxID=2747268 RepID=A0ABX7I794_9BACT|nr:UDP-2,3-diacylglucosamine diphosphatase [Dyadobacter sandarakinus]QRR01974.1 UDP-2,3-diacylglucosamine diphosphatase [Dyadobacter sandarakinus]